MSTYQWMGAGYGIPQLGPKPAYSIVIDVPQLIADGAKAGLALTSAAGTGVALASSGFAADDILEIFWVPKGFCCRGIGTYVIVAEGGTCTINAGVTSTTETHDLGGDIDGWGVFNLNATAGSVDGTADADGYGTDNKPAGIVYVTNGSIDIEFNHATDTAVFSLWAEGYWVGDLTNPD